MIHNTEITFEQLLDSRERRALKQKKLIEKYKLPLVSFTVNIPGKCKNTLLSTSIFNEGFNVLMKEFDEKCITHVYDESCGLDTGYEAYVVADTDGRLLKEHVLQIENSHPLGRMFDFDVIGTDGIAISRDDLGYPKRKCLICEQDAHSCGRSRIHPMEELINKIQIMTDAYF